VSEATRPIKIPRSIIELVIDTLADNDATGGDEDQGDLAEKLEREYGKGDTVDLTRNEMAVISDEFFGLAECGCYDGDGKNVTKSIYALAERCRKGIEAIDRGVKSRATFIVKARVAIPSASAERGGYGYSRRWGPWRTISKRGTFDKALAAMKEADTGGESKGWGIFYRGKQIALRTGQSLTEMKCPLCGKRTFRQWRESVEAETYPHGCTVETPNGEPAEKG
jgi:hypothetical protein